MLLELISAVVLSAAISDAVAGLIEFILEKRRKRLRLDPVEGVLLEKDLEVTNEIADKIRSRFSGDIGKELKSMTVNERVEKLTLIADEIAQIMGMDKQEIQFLPDEAMQTKGMGSYSFVDHKLTINLDYVKSSKEEVLFDTLDTVVHELSHAYQFQEMSELLGQVMELGDDEDVDCNPETMRTVAWIINQKNYIRFEVDPARYRKQPLEAYAFAMANAVMRQLSEEGEK